MTTTLVPEMTGPPVTDADESAVAVTLSWSASHCARQGTSGARPEGEHIVELIGEIDLFLVTRVRPMLYAVAAQSADLVIDASRVRFIDATGLGLIVAMHREVTTTGGRIRLIGVTPNLQRLLRLTRLEHLL